MSPFQAKKIADHFLSSGPFQVKNKLHGVTVSYMGHHGYFEDEQCLWPFLFHVGQAIHQEGVVAEVEAQLAA